MTTPYFIAVRPIPWERAAGDHPLPLGRNVRHDSRNRAYAHRPRDRQLTSQLWTRHIPILDQGQLGSCTGNMMTGALGTDPLFGVLPAAHAALNESLAVAIYSAAEKLDGGAGYPPEDDGSTGPSVDQVAKNLGLISGYTHAFDLASLLDALEDGPLGIGINWYSSMDAPDSSGLVTISPDASIRGGHEVLVRGKDVAAQVIHCDNSWGASWGVSGSFTMSYATIERLLGEQGDVTVPIPLNQPAPVPAPVPPAPAPDPGPDTADLTLYRNTLAWTGERHVGQNAATAKDLKTWAAAKGFT
jgi:hypothetical protein